MFADKNALPQVKSLVEKIERLAQLGYAFGHQDTTSYGIGWKNNGVVYRSDIYDVVGDYPVVYGFDIGQIEHGHLKNLDDVPFDDMRDLIKRANLDGGIITISWHADNPISNKDSWDTTKAVSYILKGGVAHDVYRGWLGRVAAFLKSLKDDFGALIPVAFRPFHEMNGSWFWWGNPNCAPEDYQQLWRQTLAILSDELEVHNLVYVYSPNLIQNSDEYVLNYPGDNYVDMLGIDLYQHGSVVEFKNALRLNLQILKDIATHKNKPYALTEVGVDKIPIAKWWTSVLDEVVSGTGIAWVLLWRNHTPEHFFVSYLSHDSVPDFIVFNNKQHVLFLKDINGIKV
tara:strand:+ start:867 stop:1895 length:1029 start_codon:yes stop_codon:yes gene_type:complete